MINAIFRIKYFAICQCLIVFADIFAYGKPIEIRAQPKNIIVDSGSDAVFFVSATIEGIPAYQWKKNGIDIAGATSENLMLSRVKADDSGNYSVVITGTKGSTITSLMSDAAELYVNTPPVITADTYVVYGAINDKVDFACSVATGQRGVISYQWQVRESSLDKVPYSNIPGASGAHHSVVIAEGFDKKQFRVIITNTIGNSAMMAASGAYSIVINREPRINPIAVRAVNVKLPGSVHFDINIEPSQNQGQLSYQWFYNNKPIKDAVNPAFDIKVVKKEDAGEYWVEVTNRLGDSITTSKSQIYTLTLSADPPRPEIKDMLNKYFSGFTQQLASVKQESNCAHVWEIDNGEISGSNTEDSILFKPGNSGAKVVLKCTSINLMGDRKTITKYADVVDPPRVDKIDKSTFAINESNSNYYNSFVFHQKGSNQPIGLAGLIIIDLLPHGETDVKRVWCFPNPSQELVIYLKSAAKISSLLSEKISPALSESQNIEEAIRNLREALWSLRCLQTSRWETKGDLSVYQVWIATEDKDPERITAMIKDTSRKISADQDLAKILNIATGTSTASDSSAFDVISLDGIGECPYTLFKFRKEASLINARGELNISAQLGKGDRVGSAGVLTGTREPLYFTLSFAAASIQSYDTSVKLLTNSPMFLGITWLPSGDAVNDNQALNAIGISGGIRISSQTKILGKSFFIGPSYRMADWSTWSNNCIWLAKIIRRLTFTGAFVWTKTDGDASPNYNREIQLLIGFNLEPAYMKLIGR